MKAPYAMVLGCAQDGSVPHLNCACSTCEAAREDYSRGHLAPCLALVTGSGRVFLIDATPDLSRQADLMRRHHLDVERPHLGFSGILLTHAHVGHYLGLAQLGREIAHANHLPLYGSELMGAFLKENKPFSYLFEREESVWTTLVPGSPLVLDDLTVSGFTVPHRNEDGDTLGFHIRGPNADVVYLPDHDEYVDATLDVLNGAGTILIDGSFWDSNEVGGIAGRRVPHPPIVESLKVLENLADRTVFTHFNHTNPVLIDSPQRRRVLGAGFRLAHEGWTTPL